MWDEGVHIYDTPRVHNNFPMHLSLNCLVYADWISIKFNRKLKK